MTGWRVRHDSLTIEAWLTHVWDMTHWYVRHDSLTCETWLLDAWDMTHWHARHDSTSCETWLLDMWHDSLTCETWLLDVWDMTPWRVRHDSCTRETWLVDVWDMTHWCLRLNSLPCAACLALLTCLPSHRLQWGRDTACWWYVCTSVCVCMCVCLCVCVCECVGDSVCGCLPSHRLQWGRDTACSCWLVDIWDMTHWCVRHDSLTCETWLADVWDMTRWHVRQTWLVNVWDTACSWLVDMWDMTRWYLSMICWHVRHDSLICKYDVLTCLPSHRSQWGRDRKGHCVLMICVYIGACAYVCVCMCVFASVWVTVCVGAYRVIDCSEEGTLRVDVGHDCARHRIRHACTYLQHDSLICETWLIQMWDMTHCHVRHDSLPCETWLIAMRDMTHWHERYDLFRWDDAFISYDTFVQCGLIDMWDMTHCHVRHDPLTYETWLIDIWDMTHWHMRHDSLTYETWLIDLWEMAHISRWNDAFISYDTFVRDMDSSMWYNSFTWQDCCAYDMIPSYDISHMLWLTHMIMTHSYDNDSLIYQDARAYDMIPSYDISHPSYTTYDFEFDYRVKIVWSGERVISLEWIIIIWTSRRVISYECKSYTMSHMIRSIRMIWLYDLFIWWWFIQVIWLALESESYHLSASNDFYSDKTIFTR